MTYPRADIPPEERRWKCETCGGLNIQVCVPAWFRESKAYDDALLDVDWEADRRFYCDDCGDETEAIDLLAEEA